MGKGLFDMILDEIFDDEWVGKHGEKLTERELKLVRLFGRKGKTLRNVYVPKNNGETSEIDVLYITQKGIFVIESKNYSGWIFGNEKSTYWAAMLSNRQKNRFYNPVKQNRTHIKWLNQYLEGRFPLFSVIVFSERCELKKVEIESPTIQVIKRDHLYATVRKIWDASPDCLEEEEVNRIYERLKVLTNVDQAVKEAHVQRIKDRYQKSEEAPIRNEQPAVSVVKNKIVADPSKGEVSKVQTDMICPRCGAELVVRTAKKGVNAGRQFLGCSQFPQCRYVRALTTDEK